jgi:hypothetical protein
MRLEDLPPAARAKAERILAQRHASQMAGVPEDADALEKDTQADVVKLFRAYGCTVYNLSQPRHAKYLTPGIPDLWVFHRASRQAWWWETKRPVGGKLSPAQVEFAQFCDETRVQHGVGSRADVESWLCDIGLAVRQADGTIEPSRAAA